MGKLNREIKIGKRILFIDCDESKECRVHNHLMNFVLKREEYFDNLMDMLDIPDEVLLNFKKAYNELEGFYHEQDRRVEKYLVAIDIYIGENENNSLKEMVDTFIHELVHHKIKPDRETIELTNEIMDDLFG
jgi:hypothetical protein